MRIYCLCCLLTIFLAGIHSSCQALEHVKIHLRWHHQFQFAGYYAAIAQGYYREKGYDVELLEGGVNVNTVGKILDGDAQYGVTNSELVLYRLQGAPVVALAAIFQHSPHVFLTREATGIRHPHDFIGKRIKMSRDIRDIELHAMLTNEEISLDDFTIIEKEAKPADYLSKEFDVVAAYITDQTYYLEQAGEPYVVISPSAYGIDFYGDTLFTTEKEIQVHPKRAKAIREATLKGWKYALEHPAEIVELILTVYKSDKSRAHLLNEAEETRKLVLPGEVSLGHMNVGRWYHVANTFARHEMLNKEFTLDGFVYDSDMNYQDRQKLMRLNGVLLSIICGVVVAVAFLLVFNRRLKKEIIEHKNTAKALQQSQKKIAEHAEQIEQFSLSAASILTIEDEKVLFANISKAIVEYSDFSRVLISLFKDEPPYRDLIGFAGVSEEIIERVKTTELSKKDYDKVFQKGILIGQFSYYIPFKMKDILNQKAVIYGEGEVPESNQEWHPEDNLFVRMNDENGEFIGVISVDTSKSGLAPTDEVVRPLEIYASLIAQIIILKRTMLQRKHLEAQLRQAQKMEAIGNLTGGIAHDFNNILGVIIGNVEMALRMEPEDGISRPFLADIRKASHRARDVVQHLLAFSRKQERELKTVQVEDILADSIKFLRSTIPSTVTIFSEIDLQGWNVEADPTQIYQIVLNLCTNSAHAMENGGDLKIKAEVVESDFLQGVCSVPLVAGKYVKLSIKDSGHGIPKESLHKIFDPYYTTKGIGKGTGMGLAIVHGIVESHKGTITVDSEVGQGTTFSIYLPVSKSDMEISDRRDVVVDGKNERVMVVDDNGDLLKIMERQLQGLGYLVESFQDSGEAWKAFQEDPDRYDAVLTDMTMPGITGEELTRNILGLKADTIIFLCTGYSDKIDEEKSLSIGIRKYFEKPVLFSTLSAELREELDRRR